MKHLLLFDVAPLGSDGLSRLWRTRGPLDPSNCTGKTNGFSTFSLFFTFPDPLSDATVHSVVRSVGGLAALHLQKVG